MNSPTPNRLIHEKSPYLLQHAYNPVDWFPWGEEAFTKARKENKPVFLSIGYSTCHWCHVMERESFEDPATAEILNTYFVAIKVDREERPDIDSIHMAVVTSLTGAGGWPMSVFLTPDKKPFFGGTYYPPTARWGSPGFSELLLAIHNNWQTQEAKIRKSGESIAQALAERFKGGSVKSGVPDQKLLHKAYEELRKNFDPKEGGFGHAPKFPMGHTLSFLLRYWKNFNEPQALGMVEKTLIKMAAGGLYDQLGGGFHRYSTDGKWQVPHFEKMAYDQALLAKAYLEAFQATKNSLYGQVARETLDYILRDMHDQRGGFFSAEDADSLEPGVHEAIEKTEGAFYLWTKDELRKALADEEFKVVEFYYGILEGGNAEADPQGEFIGKNVLHVHHSIEETVRYFNLTEDEVQRRIYSAKEKLYNLRQKRPRPSLDDKVLVDWNGLLISSFALAGRVLEDVRYLQAAEYAAQFILKKMRDSKGRLLHRYRDNDAAIAAPLDDYAYLVQGLLDLYENTFNPEYFSEAVRLTAEMIDLFGDGENGGFFSTPKDGEDLFLRPKEVYDGAVPSGNSVAALNLLRLYHFTSDAGHLAKSEMVLATFQEEVAFRPSAYTQYLIALNFYLGPVKEIVVAGEVSAGKGEEMLKVILSSWIPQKVLIIKTRAVSQKIEALMPFTKAQSPHEKETRVFVCERQTCQNPAKNAEELRAAL